MIHLKLSYRWLLWTDLSMSKDFMAANIVPYTPIRLSFIWCYADSIKPCQIVNVNCKTVMPKCSCYNDVPIIGRDFTDEIAVLIIWQASNAENLISFSTILEIVLNWMIALMIVVAITIRQVRNEVVGQPVVCCIFYIKLCNNFDLGIHYCSAFEIVAHNYYNIVSLISDYRGCLFGIDNFIHWRNTGIVCIIDSIE